MSDAQLRYIPALDGLRGLAVLSVALLHFGFPLPGGSYGVDIFFVLSGYLITYKLRNEHTGFRSIGRFYFNRFTRLFPPLITVSACVFLLVPYAIPFQQAWRDFASTLLYVSNWTRAIPAGAPMYLGHTWSLSIEEQFYLIWPMIFFAASARHPRAALWSTAALLAVSLAWLYQMILSDAEYARIYNGFDTRCPALLMGCIASQLQPPRIPRAIVWSCAAIAAVFLVAGEWNPRIAPLFWLCSTVIVFSAFRQDNGALQRILTRREIVFLGKISYSYYLWHYPIALFLGYHLHLRWPIVMVVGGAVSFFLSVATYEFVERPVKSWKAEFPGQEMFGRITASLAICGLALGIWIFWHAQILNLIDPKPVEITAFGPTSIRAGEPFNVQSDGTSVMWMTLSIPAPAGTRIRIGDTILPTALGGMNLSATIPPEFRTVPGSWPIALVTKDGRTLTQSQVRFEVR